MPRKPKAPTSLVIVESPAKAKTLQRILGPGHVVKASLGHVRDLPPRALGIEIENGFAPVYREIPGRKKVLAGLRAAARDAETVYLAPDPDREGEAIAWHLAEALGLRDARRVAFHEITERAVLDAFRRPAAISMDRVHAQQARRVLDRLVGWKLSPLLWTSVGKGLSAGRVQTVAVRLVVEREREIRAFRVEDYWTIRAFLEKDGRAFSADLVELDGRPCERMSDGGAAAALVEELKRAAFEVLAVEARAKPEPPRPPLTTSLLQQEAAHALHWPAARTMKVAQQLYEEGLITYMRTDAFRIAPEALAEVRGYIGRTHGPSYVPEKAPFRRARPGAQGAHEAIRPTSVARTPEAWRARLTREQAELYRLIWRRFVASQMKPALHRVTEASIAAGRARFVARGRETLFDGWTALGGASLGDPALPALAAGDRPERRDVAATRRQTEAPPRYTEASLIRTLEKHGIGRPSTYAPILSTIRERGYVSEEGRALVPTGVGEGVVDRLLGHFEALLSTAFTARMEKQLDLVEAGRAPWTSVLQEFWTSFEADLEKAKTPAAAGVDCAACGKPMLLRWSKGARFLGCSGYPACEATRPLEGQSIPVALSAERCELCGRPMAERGGRYGRFLSCTGYPACKGARGRSRGTSRFEVPAGWSEACDKCGKPLKIRRGRRGGYILCSAYPRCKNSKRFPRDWDRTLRAAK